MEGSCFSLSALERRIGAIFFYWDVYNMFLQVSGGDCGGSRAILDAMWVFVGGTGPCPHS